MSRTRKEIKQALTADFMASPGVVKLYGLPEEALFEKQFSLVSLENIFFEVYSFCLFIMEKLFDQHEKEVDDRLNDQPLGSLNWYRTMALRYQAGHELGPMDDQEAQGDPDNDDDLDNEPLIGLDQYDNRNKSDNEVALSRIIKYAAANESAEKNRIILKVAKAQELLDPTSNTLVKAPDPLTEAEIKAFETNYLNKIKFAGTAITVLSCKPDKLWLEMQIYCNPMLLDATGMATGMAVDSGTRPVEEALRDYLNHLPFDGELVLEHLIDRLQQVPGVEIPHIKKAEYRPWDPLKNDYGVWTTINIRQLPYSGHFKLEGFEKITYKYDEE